MSTYETIKLEDYIQTGEGGTAQAYTRKDGKFVYVGDEADLAGPQSYHQDDYSIFYNNIKDNVTKRMAAYLNR